MSGATAFFNRTYDECMALLIETRNYVAYTEATDLRPLPPGLRLQASYESMRVTSRLTQVMAWLLAQKAVHAGEMTARQAASEEYALSGGALCTDAGGQENTALPGGLRSLLARSHGLYLRVERLDDMVRRNVAAA